jgi:anti-sigma factor RsiW
LNCEELEDLLHAFVDGELDLTRSLEVERHLQGCPACAGAVEGHQALHKALNHPSLYHRPPGGWEDRVRKSLRASISPRRVLPWRSFALAASVALTALLVGGVLRIRSQPSADELLAQQVASSHVRALMEKNHLVDVESADQHTVKPWFNGRVDFSPPVKNLADQGFPLVGGRLEYLDRHKAAALIYKRNQHIINLFIWRASDSSPRPPEAISVQGNWRVIHWIEGGLTYWAVSDLNELELQEFVRLIRAQ